MAATIAAENRISSSLFGTHSALHQWRELTGYSYFFVLLE
jgi:hypothetical protein